MLGILLESRARRQRRSGGAALSVATHLAIIGAVSVASAHGAPRGREPVKTPIVRIVPPTPKPVDRRPEPAEAHPARVVSLLELPRSRPAFVAPAIVPVGLPRIELSSGTPLDSLLLERGTGRGGTSRGIVVAGDDPPHSGAWTGTELLMRITTSAKPRYPEVLRQAGIDGRVLVQFIVDSAGKVDVTTIQVLSSTHDLFTRAVRDVLPAFRFKPAEINGRPVRSLAEMPFEFRVK
jgi:protein TonB